MEIDQETRDLVRDTASNVKHIRELLENSQEDIRDHEARIRALESHQKDAEDIEDHETRLRVLEDNQRLAAGMYRGAAKVAGVVALGISLLFVGLQLLIVWWCK